MSDPILVQLAAPLTKFMDVVSRGIGTCYEPYGTVRQAKADADAILILTKADIEKQELLYRAAVRLRHTETQRQKNIESVVEVAKQALPSSVSDDPVDQDWINHFFDGVKDVSSEDLQELWGRILAGEVTSPGRFTRRLVEFLKTIERNEAEMLTALFSVCFTDADDWNFYFETEATNASLREAIGDGDVLRHFVDIGILSGGFDMMNLSDTTGFKIQYSGHSYIMEGPPKPLDSIDAHSPLEQFISIRRLSAIGQQLALVATAKKDPDLVSKISDELSSEFEVSIRPL